MLAPAALAQTQPTTQQQTPPPAGAAASRSDTGATPNDTELKHFADAVVEVQGIRQDLQPKLADAQSEGARTKLKAAAEKKMESAVKSNQLSLDRYVQIAKLVQTDSQIRARVQQLMPPQQPSKS
ncbi:DUF4168 domain-containing protein [Dyella sp.]|uniref:DUF4168 domain-containing protein n=1 Tax=Dyella sp. TaxID=1869338 RepID=UPI002D76AD12|nr:DUF4168 domain-containing protein [Dyella sp.]